MPTVSQFRQDCWRRNVKMNSGETLQNHSPHPSLIFLFSAMQGTAKCFTSHSEEYEHFFFSPLWLTACLTLCKHIIKLTNLVKEAGYKYTSNFLQLLLGPDIINIREVILVPDINISCLSGQWQLSKNVRQLRGKTVFWIGHNHGEIQAHNINTSKCCVCNIEPYPSPSHKPGQLRKKG